MMNIKSKNEEFAFFNQLSDEWWNENGKFKTLHQIKSHRITYILDQIKNRDIAKLLKIDYWTTIVVYKDNKELAREIGLYKEEDIYNLIKKGI